MNKIFVFSLSRKWEKEKDWVLWFLYFANILSASKWRERWRETLNYPDPRCWVDYRTDSDWEARCWPTRSLDRRQSLSKATESSPEPWRSSTHPCTFWKSESGSSSPLKLQTSDPKIKGADLRKPKRTVVWSWRSEKVKESQRTWSQTEERGNGKSRELGWGVEKRRRCTDRCHVTGGDTFLSGCRITRAVSKRWRGLKEDVGWIRRSQPMRDSWYSCMYSTVSWQNLK